MVRRRENGRRERRKAGGRKNGGTLVVGEKRAKLVGKNGGTLPVGRKVKGEKTLAMLRPGCTTFIPISRAVPRQPRVRSSHDEYIKYAKLNFQEPKQTSLHPGVRVTCQRQTAGQGDQGNLYTTGLFHYCSLTVHLGWNWLTTAFRLQQTSNVYSHRVLTFFVCRSLA